MTIKQITARQEIEAAKYAIARKMREELDALAKKYGADWDKPLAEEQICELVFGED